MTRYILLSLGLLALIPTAMAADAVDPKAAPENCTLDATAIKPILVVEPLYKPSHHILENAKERTITEMLTVENGLKISYTVGGCAHYVFSYKFEEIPETLSKDYEPIDLAIVLFNNVPGFKEGPHNFLTEMLKEAKRKGNLPDDDGRFDCGEAKCSLERNRDEKKLEFSYDFAL